MFLFYSGENYDLLWVWRSSMKSLRFLFTYEVVGVFIVLLFRVKF